MGNQDNKIICLITPGHLASNPRLVKEAQTLSLNGFKVHIIFTQNLEFLVSHDLKIITDNPCWTTHVLNNCTLNSLHKIKNRILSLLHGIFKILFFYFNIPIFTKFLINKNYYWQYKKAKNIKAQLFIAHNLGSLPIAAMAAKHQNTKYAFDAEDFHRNESDNKFNTYSYKLNKFIEDNYLINVQYLTTASPLISSAYQRIYKNIVPTTINNVFSVKNLHKPYYKREDSLELFWFSQTIGKDRGIEDVIYAIGKLPKYNINLNLLGNINFENKLYFQNLIKQYRIDPSKIKFIKTVPEFELFEIASQYDIGLALERKFPINRNICLTNKIFTYLLSGLAIIATNTIAQSDFLNSNPNIGKLYNDENPDELVDILKFYIENKIILQETKKHSYFLALDKYNWEKESQIFLKVINQILNN